MPSLSSPFLEIAPPRVPDPLVPFSLLPAHFEREFGARNGNLDLGAPRAQLRAKMEKHAEIYRSLVPFFSTDGVGHSSRALHALAISYPELRDPCSLEVSSSHELGTHLTRLFQVSYAHYGRARGANMKGSFPSYCCGKSSINVALSLMAFGYPMATYGYDLENDHGYVVLPFVMKDQGIRGCILQDPTSDQLWPSQAAPRNLVSIRLGSQWKYQTLWKSGRNLFPSHFLDFSSLQTFLDVYTKDTSLFLTNTEHYDTRGGDVFFTDAFSHPVPYQPEATRELRAILLSSDHVRVIQR